MPSMSDMGMFQQLAFLHRRSSIHGNWFGLPFIETERAIHGADVFATVDFGSAEGLRYDAETILT
jgi:hypothetical protein